jgi:hypothetical protein
MEGSYLQLCSIPFKQVKYRVFNLINSIIPKDNRIKMLSLLQIIYLWWSYFIKIQIICWKVQEDGVTTYMSATHDPQLSDNQGG